MAVKEENKERESRSDYDNINKKAEVILR